MIRVIHTFQNPDQASVLPQIQKTLENIEATSGFKYASLDQKENSQEYMLESKWDDRNAYDTWARNIGQNNPISQAAPQFLNVIQEKY